MNKEFIYIDGKAIVKYEDGKLRQAEFYDNLEEVLNQENVIEIMEDKISILEKQSKHFKKKIYIPYILPMVTLITLIFPKFIIEGLIGGPTLIDTRFGVMNETTFITSICCIFLIPIGAFFECLEYIQHKSSIKEIKGINSELEFLRKQIELEKKRLLELKKFRTKTIQDNNFGTVTLNCSQELEHIERATRFAHELGIKSDKYYKYYKKGKLDKKLKKTYTDEGIEIIKDYLVENEPSLSAKGKKRILKR